MQVGVDVTYMHTKFGSVAFLVSKILLQWSPWSSKNVIARNRFKKFMQVGIDVKCMFANFCGRDLFGFGDTATFKNDQFSLSDHGL